MRLIDGDALLYDLEIVPLTGDGGVDVNDLDDIIKRQPTIEERKKGKWIPHPVKEFREWDVCTACGTGCKRREYGMNPDGMEWVEQENYPFCPNCGADMRGEEDG